LANNPIMRHGESTPAPGELAGTARSKTLAANEAVAPRPPSPPLSLMIAPDAMLCLTADGIICDVNERAVALFGYHAKLMAGAHLGAFISTSTESSSSANPARSEELLQRLARGDGQVIEATAHTLSGNSPTVEMTSIRHQQSGTSYIVCALRDVSHRKHNEDVLVAAKEVAERANVAKLEFLSQLSHELRTPLAAIIGFGEVMRDEMFGPLGIKLYQTYAADICQSGRQLTNVVERIIDVARLEGRMATAHARTADLGEIIERVIERLAVEASKQNVRLHNNVRRGSIPVILDDETLEKMICHVVDNAITFNRFGGKVDISAATDTAKDGNLVQLTVTDTGPGMQPIALEALKRSLDGARSEASGGLELCAAFLHLIGGSLEICSAVSLGTTVTLNFPRRYDGRWKP
jgi:PAS domain S-box-containing protein